MAVHDTRNIVNETITQQLLRKMLFDLQQQGFSFGPEIQKLDRRGLEMLRDGAKSFLEHGNLKEGFPSTTIVEIRLLLLQVNSALIELSLGESPKKSGVLPTKRLTKFLRTLELAARVVPSKARREAFEPAYEQAKYDYLSDRQRYGGPFARKWLSFWFGVHVVVLVVQSLYCMCSERVKRAIFGFLNIKF